MSRGTARVRFEVRSKAGRRRERKERKCRVSTAEAGDEANRCFGEYRECRMSPSSLSPQGSKLLRRARKEA